MIRNYKEEYKVVRRNAMDIAKTADDPEKHTLYLSFTRYGKSVLKKENEKLLDDAELDYELGILNENEYSRLKIAHDIIEKSIANGHLY